MPGRKLSAGLVLAAVAAGLEADIVALSLEPDMTKLVDAGLVAETWNGDEHKGMVTDSVVVLATPEGTPKNVKTWDDLVKPGVDYLYSLFKNVPVQDSSARKSLQTFSGGKGDVLLAYENEAIFAKQQKQPLDYTVPDSTILIENPVAVTKNSKHAAEAEAFLKFLRGKRAQEIFVKNGYRPVVEGVPGGDEFPEPPGLFTIADLGGWEKVSTEFFDPEDGLMVGVEKSVGVSTRPDA